MSLRWKLTLALAVVAASATLAVGWSSYRATSERLLQEVDSSLDDVSRRIEDDSGRPPNPREPWGGNMMFFGQRPFGAQQYVVQVLDADGAIIAASEGFVLPVSDADTEIASSGTGRALRSATGTIDDESVHVRVSTVPLASGGAVQLARDLGETDRVLDDLRIRTAWLIAIVAAIGALTGWLVSRSVTRSLLRLTDAASEVATTGRLDVPVPVSGRDETGRLGAAFNTMLDALQRSKAQQQRLVQDAGHELRTPLTSLRTNIDVLRKHDTMSPEIKAQVLDDLDREAGQLAALVEEVVELATDRREQEAVQRVELAVIARAAAERVTRRTGRTVRLDTDGSALDGRPAALQRAVDNLLDNASKFDQGDQAIELTVRAGTVEVHDHGPGIAEADLPVIWERFHRADTARPLPGSGLGLSIVADVVASHGGTVFARNHPSGGAVVGFTLPV